MNSTLQPRVLIVLLLWALLTLSVTMGFYAAFSAQQRETQKTVAELEAYATLATTALLLQQFAAKHTYASADYQRFTEALAQWPAELPLNELWLIESDGRFFNNTGGNANQNYYQTQDDTDFAAAATLLTDSPNWQTTINRLRNSPYQTTRLPEVTENLLLVIPIPGPAQRYLAYHFRPSQINLICRNTPDCNFVTL